MGRPLCEINFIQEATMKDYKEILRKISTRIKKLSARAREELELQWVKFKHSRSPAPARETEIPYVPVAHRRSYQRYIINTKAAVTTLDNTSRELILNNLCARGAGVVSGFPLDARSIIKITFNAPKIFNTPVTKEAHVAWCSKIGVNLWQAGMDFGLDNLLDMRM